MSDTVSIVAAVLGGFILLYGLCSLVIKERLYLSEASVALICGIIFGPVCANFVNVHDWGNEKEITHQLMRFAIGIQVMATGVSLPRAYLRTELVSILILLGPVMIYMWCVSGLLVWALIPGLNYLESLMIAACFTPTDPVLANSIVQGKFAEKHVPSHVRNIIACESGANDGLGYPFLFLAIYLLQMDTGPAIGKWAYWTMCYNVLLSIAIGLVVGYIGRKLLKYAEQRKFIDKESFLVFAVALALFLMGTVGLINSDDLLACFIAGNSLTWNDWFRVETENAHLTEVVDVLLNLSVFVYIGFTMPWSSFADTANQITIWRLVVLAILVLLLRRLPIVVALHRWIPAIHNWREAVFTGWFGPIGVGAIFYYTVALESIPEDGPNAHARAVLMPIIYFMVLASVVAHGITIPLFYIGTFATRTLTRTSEMSNQVLRIPKISKFNRKTSDEVNLDDGNMAPMPKGVEVEDEEETPRKHTAITILTPKDIPEHTIKSSNNTPLIYPMPLHETTSPADSSCSVSYSSNRNGDDSNETSANYLPISRNSSRNSN